MKTKTTSPTGRNGKNAPGPTNTAVKVPGPTYTAVKVPAPGPPSFRPAHFAPYGDLAPLRHDYPLVLTGAEEASGVESLSARFDKVLREIAPRGAEGERLRCHVLRMETAIRGLVFSGEASSLGKAWEDAGKALLSTGGEGGNAAMAEDFARAGETLGLDGDLLACDANTPAAVTTHIWRGIETWKARAFHYRIDRLLHRLENFLGADALSRPEAWESPSLRRSMGGAFADAIDFAALGGILQSIAARSALPPSRRKRLRQSLSILKNQTLFPRENDACDAHVFDSLEKAVNDRKERLEEMSAILRAIAVAELELSNHYREPFHDEVLKNLDPSFLRVEDIAGFPFPLVFLRNVTDPFAIGALLDTLSSGVPWKIVLVSDEALEKPPVSARVAELAIDLDDVFVLQTTSARLATMNEAIKAGFTFTGPALFHICTGCSPHTAHLPPYLAAAAATESRAFPCFTFDPSAGTEWADRFDVGQNPSPDKAWPEHPFSWENARQERVSQSAAFTWIDFAGCDRDFDDRFHSVPPEEWGENMLPVADYLKLSGKDREGKTPFVPAIDDGNRLWRRVPDEALIAAASRCARKWRSLQELGGIDNSHAQRLLEKERARWNEEKEAEMEALRTDRATAARAHPPAETPPPPGAPAETSAEETAETEKSPSPDPWIETPRCTSCEECIKINNRIFAYDGNKQAIIADPDAGTYADLVRAAESCQVAIIHPGKPRNPNEPGLEDLVKRSEPFL